MKKQLLLLYILIFSFTGLKAAPGDTTWIQAHYDTHLSWFGNYDTTLNFPTASYRKIYMVFTLGKYACPGYDPNNPGDQPGQTGWCGDWDYTIQNYLMTPTGDTLELGRLITPYARQNAPRTPLSWKQRYVFDVTDFYPLLKNTNVLRIHYSGYSGGFTADVKFAFIEGTPDRNVLGIHKLYGGSFNYGDPTNSIENFLPAQTINVPAGTQSALMKFAVTGHGADGNKCSEFCSKYYQVLLNNNVLAQKNIWRNNCGLNHLYPQSGTWLLNRSNWCPGDQVEVFNHALSGVTGGNNYTVDVNFENYTRVGSGNPVYTIESAVFYYDDFNKNIDAGLLDVIAPNNFEAYYRQNSLCGKPQIKVKNTGKTNISSIKFKYGVEGSFMPDYTWTGTLHALDEAVIELPEPWSLRTITGDTATYKFSTKIMEVNGQIDEDTTNNLVSVSFKPAPKWPVKIIVRMNTNAATTSQGVSETSWKILDLNDNIVAQRSNCAPNTQYNDTLTLGPSCYKLVVEDAGCDGLKWWANPSAGNGLFAVRSLGSGLPFSLKGYSTGGYAGDFGCGFTQYFTTDWPTTVTNVSSEQVSLEAFPNPAKNNVTIAINTPHGVNGRLRIIDAIGRTVLERQCEAAIFDINTKSLSNGVYTVLFDSKNLKAQTRLVIAR